MEDKLLTPIVYTPNILQHISRCEMILSRIPDNNIVKQFLIKELYNPIHVCATKLSHTDYILKHISQIENYKAEKEILEFKTSIGEGARRKLARRIKTV